ICAASYMGPNAPVLAVQLAEQIRTKHGMPAYIINRGNAERRQADEEWARTRQSLIERGIPVPRRRTIRIEEQCSVVIGATGAGWAAIDAASSFVKKVRSRPLPELRLDNGVPAYDMVHRYVPVDKSGRAELKAMPVNPFTSSFVTRNPTVPQEARAKNKFDP